jgi:hypothetical protein
MVYGYSNLYNPPETEFMIRERFPYLQKKLASLSGKMTMYSRLGSGEPLKAVFSSTNDFESPSPGWSENSAGYDNSFALSGKYSERMDSSILYSSTFRKTIHDITKMKDVYLIITADVFLVGNSNPLLVYTEYNGDQTRIWLSLDVHKFVKYSNQWEKVFFMVRAGRHHSKNDTAGLYFWNPDKSTFYIDNVRIAGYKIDDFRSKSDY